jgi:hypothetical protein
MICILVISITPVTLYHDLLSDHIDKNIQHKHSDQTEVATGSVNCHMDGFVADKNYTFTIESFDFRCPGITCLYIHKPAPDFYSQHHFYAELRGPPSLI